MKVAPVFHALTTVDGMVPTLVHTGQHSSPEMSDVFFEELGLPKPHFRLSASGTTHATQTASVLAAYEALLLDDRPDWVIVAGDVNSTLAACLAARKLNIPVAHLEAGLRSGDRSMPEEINRIAVDGMADLLWTPSEDADANLQREGIPASRIERVGNVMIDAYCSLAPAIARSATPDSLGLRGRPYVVATFHRPVNVDDEVHLRAITDQLIALAAEVTVVFPVHPRTQLRLAAFGLRDALDAAGLHLLSPLGYVDFMSLVQGAAAVVTDSGGVQEETSFLGIPCVTVRESTERPITITMGTNRLSAREQLAVTTRAAIAHRRERPDIPLWDGRASGRIVASLARHV